MPSVVGMKRFRGVAQPEGAFGSTGAVLECADDFRHSGSSTGRRNFLIARWRSPQSPITNRTTLLLMLMSRVKRRSKERGVGKEWFMPCRSRWWPAHEKKI